MTSVRVMLLLLLLHSVIECVTGQLPFGKIKLPGQSVLSSLLPPSGATISRNDDKYLIKAHVGGNEVKFLKLGLGGEKNSAAALQPAAPAILSSPQVSPDVLGHRSPVIAATRNAPQVAAVGSHSQSSPYIVEDTLYGRRRAAAAAAGGQVDVPITGHAHRSTGTGTGTSTGGQGYDYDTGGGQYIIEETLYGKRRAKPTPLPVRNGIGLNGLVSEEERWRRQRLIEEETIHGGRRAAAHVDDHAGNRAHGTANQQQQQQQVSAASGSPARLATAASQQQQQQQLASQSSSQQRQGQQIASSSIPAAGLSGRTFVPSRTGSPAANNVQQQTLTLPGGKTLSQQQLVSSILRPLDLLAPVGASGSSISSASTSISQQQQQQGSSIDPVVGGSVPQQQQSASGSGSGSGSGSDAIYVTGADQQAQQAAQSADSLAHSLINEVVAGDPLIVSALSSPQPQTQQPQPGSGQFGAYSDPSLLANNGQSSASPASQQAFSNTGTGTGQPLQQATSGPYSSASSQQEQQQQSSGSDSPYGSASSPQQQQQQQGNSATLVSASGYAQNQNQQQQQEVSGAVSQPQGSGFASDAYNTLSSGQQQEQGGQGGLASNGVTGSGVNQQPQQSGSRSGLASSLIPNSLTSGLISALVPQQGALAGQSAALSQQTPQNFLSSGSGFDPRSVLTSGGAYLTGSLVTGYDGRAGTTDVVNQILATDPVSDVKVIPGATTTKMISPIIMNPEMLPNRRTIINHEPVHSVIYGKPTSWIKSMTNVTHVVLPGRQPKKKIMRRVHQWFEEEEVDDDDDDQIEQRETVSHAAHSHQPVHHFSTGGGSESVNGGVAARAAAGIVQSNSGENGQQEQQVAGSQFGGGEANGQQQTDQEQQEQQLANEGSGYGNQNVDSLLTSPGAGTEVQSLAAGIADLNALADGLSQNLGATVNNDGLVNTGTGFGENGPLVAGNAFGAGDNTQQQSEPGQQEQQLSGSFNDHPQTAGEQQQSQQSDGQAVVNEPILPVPIPSITGSAIGAGQQEVLADPSTNGFTPFNDHPLTFPTGGEQQQSQQSGEQAAVNEPILSLPVPSGSAVGAGQQEVVADPSTNVFTPSNGLEQQASSSLHDVIGSAAPLLEAAAGVLANNEQVAGSHPIDPSVSAGQTASQTTGFISDSTFSDPYPIGSSQSQSQSSSSSGGILPDASSTSFQSQSSSFGSNLLTDPMAVLSGSSSHSLTMIPLSQREARWGTVIGSALGPNDMPDEELRARYAQVAEVLGGGKMPPVESGNHFMTGRDTAGVLPALVSGSEGITNGIPIIAAPAFAPTSLQQQPQQTTPADGAGAGFVALQAQAADDVVPVAQQQPAGVGEVGPDAAASSAEQQQTGSAVSPLADIPFIAPAVPIDQTGHPVSKDHVDPILTDAIQITGSNVLQVSPVSHRNSILNLNPAHETHGQAFVAAPYHTDENSGIAHQSAIETIPTEQQWRSAYPGLDVNTLLQPVSTFSSGPSIPTAGSESSSQMQEQQFVGPAITDQADEQPASLISEPIGTAAGVVADQAAGIVSPGLTSEPILDLSAQQQTSNVPAVDLTIPIAGLADLVASISDPQSMTPVSETKQSSGQHHEEETVVIKSTSSESQSQNGGQSEPIAEYVAQSAVAEAILIAPVAVVDQSNPLASAAGQFAAALELQPDSTKPIAAGIPAQQEVLEPQPDLPVPVGYSIVSGLISPERKPDLSGPIESVAVPAGQISFTAEPVINSHAEPSSQSSAKHQEEEIVVIKSTSSESQSQDAGPSVQVTSDAALLSEQQSLSVPVLTPEEQVALSQAAASLGVPVPSPDKDLPLMPQVETNAIDGLTSIAEQVLSRDHPEILNPVAAAVPANDLSLQQAAYDASAIPLPNPDFYPGARFIEAPLAYGPYQDPYQARISNAIIDPTFLPNAPYLAAPFVTGHNMPIHPYPYYGYPIPYSVPFNYPGHISPFVSTLQPVVPLVGPVGAGSGIAEEQTALQQTGKPGNSLLTQSKSSNVNEEIIITRTTENSSSSSAEANILPQVQPIVPVANVPNLISHDDAMALGLALQNQPHGSNEVPVDEWHAQKAIADNFLHNIQSPAALNPVPVIPLPIREPIPAVPAVLPILTPPSPALVLSPLLTPEDEAEMDAEEQGLSRVLADETDPRWSRIWDLFFNQTITEEETSEETTFSRRIRRRKLIRWLKLNGLFPILCAAAAAASNETITCKQKMPPIHELNPMLVPFLSSEDLAVNEQLNQVIGANIAAAEEAAYADHANDVMLGQAADLLTDYHIKAQHALNAAAVIGSEHQKFGQRVPVPQAPLVAPAFVPSVPLNPAALPLDPLAYGMVHPAYPLSRRLAADDQFSLHPGTRMRGPATHADQQLDERMSALDHAAALDADSFHRLQSPQTGWHPGQQSYGDQGNRFVPGFAPSWRPDRVPFEFPNYNANRPFRYRGAGGHAVPRRRPEDEEALRLQRSLEQDVRTFEASRTDDLIYRQMWDASAPDVRDMIDKDRLKWQHDQQIRKQLLDASAPYRQTAQLPSSGGAQQQQQQQQQQAIDSTGSQQQQQQQQQETGSTIQHPIAAPPLDPAQLLMLHDQEYLMGVQQAEQMMLHQQLLQQGAALHNWHANEQMRGLLLNYLSSNPCNKTASQQQQQSSAAGTEQQQSGSKSQSENLNPLVASSLASLTAVEEKVAHEAVYEETKKEKERVRAALIDVLDDIDVTDLPIPLD